jgi:hypothetical protein
VSGRRNPWEAYGNSSSSSRRRNNDPAKRSMHTHCALPFQKPVSGAFLHPYDDVLQAEHEILHSRPSSLTDEKLQAVPIFFGVLTGMGKRVLMLWN